MKRSLDPNQNTPLSLFEKICVAACCFIVFTIFVAVLCCNAGCRYAKAAKTDAPKTTLNSVNETYPLPHRWWSSSRKYEN